MLSIAREGTSHPGRLPKSPDTLRTMSDEKHALARRPVAFFNFTPDDLTDEHIEDTCREGGEGDTGALVEFALP